MPSNEKSVLVCWFVYLKTFVGVGEKTAPMAIPLICWKMRFSNNVGV